MIFYYYILKSFLRNIILVLLLSLFLFVLFDFIHMSTSYLPQHDPSSVLVFQLLMSRIPGFLIQAFPVTTLIASLVTLVVFSKNNELVSLRAAGFSPVMMVKPLLGGGVLLSLAAMAVSEVVVPRATEIQHQFQDQIENKSPDLKLYRQPWMKFGNQVFAYQSSDESGSILEDVKLLKLNDNFQPVQTIRARTASYSEENKFWGLEDAILFDLGGAGGVTKRQHIKMLTISLPIAPKNFRVDRRDPREMSLWQIQQRVRDRVVLGADTRDLRVAWHLKLSFAWASLIVCLVGLPFFFSTGRSNRFLSAIIVCAGIGGCYWVLYTAGELLARTGNLPALAGGWLANICLVIIVVAHSMVSAYDPN